MLEPHGNKSRTSTERALRLVAWILLTSEASDLAFKCQFLSVRSITAIPLALMCGMVLDMWLEPDTMRLRGGGSVLHIGCSACIGDPFGNDAGVNAGGERSI